MSPAAAVVYEKPTREDTVLNAQIFVVGGAGPDGLPLDTIEYYDRPTDSWNLLNARLEHKRRDCAAVALDQKVYVLGGDRGGTKGGGGERGSGDDGGELGGAGGRSGGAGVVGGDEGGNGDSGGS